MNPANTASVPYAVVVNDDPTQLQLLCGLVRKAGLEPRAFTGAEAALAAMTAMAAMAATAGTLPALIVTDLHMPGLDGWRFCRLLRAPDYAALNPIPILVVSATFTGDEPHRIAADLGADAFLSSPVDGQRFVAQVQAILQGWQLRNPSRVLVVEDSRTLAGILKKALVAQGYAADLVLTVQAAVAAFSAAPYDVAVIDYHLPDGSGSALLDAFQKQRPDCICIMMTSDPGPELALDWMKRGAAAYLRKPFEPEYLIELCAKARRERALLRVQDLLDVRTRELRRSQTLLNTVQHLSKIGGWEWDVASQTMMWTDEVYSLHDMTPGDPGPGSPEHIARSLACYASADRPRIQAAFQRCVEQGESYDLELPFTTVQGRRLWIRTTAEAVKAQGRVVKVVGNLMDITERKRLQDALDRRLVALTRPLDQPENITFGELFDVSAMQRTQDEFAAATGVASIITHPDGTPITRPSNFCRLCKDLIRGTEIGRCNCHHSDAVLGHPHPDGPRIQPCLSGGLWDAGVSITVGDRHIANWLIGQVRVEAHGEEKMLAYARTIGADEAVVREAFREVPTMSLERFKQVAQVLFTLANQLATSAYQNVQQARFISERQEVEAALREAEWKFRALFEQGPIGVAYHEMLYDASGKAVDYRFLDANASYRELTGVDPRGMKVTQAFPGIEHDPFDWIGTFGQVARTGESIRFEQYLKPNGRWYDCVAYQYKPDHFVAAFLEITKRKLAEAALREKTALLEAQLQASIEGILVVGPQGKKILQNQRTAELWKIPPQILNNDDDQAQVQHVMRMTRDPETFVAQINYLYLHPAATARDEVELVDGTVLDRYSGPVRDKDGQYYGRIWTFHDITARKHAETYREMGRDVLQILNETGDFEDAIPRVLAALKTRTGVDAVGIRLQKGDDFPYSGQDGFAKEFLLTENSLVERVAEGCVCPDKDGSTRLECTCGLVLSGTFDPAHPLFTPGGSFWTNESFPLLDLPPSLDSRHHPRNQCIHHGYASMALVPIRTGDRIVGLLQFNARRQGCFSRETVGFLEDTAAHLGVALMRKRAERAVSDSLREKEALLKEIHHRVKNNLQIIVSLLRLQSGTIENPAARAALKDMQNRAHSMALIHELLYGSERLADVDMARYIQKLCSYLFKTQVGQPNTIRIQTNMVAIRLGIDQAIPCGLLVNELVSNALKHAFPDGQAGELRVELQPVAGGPEVCLRVADNGVGLPADLDLGNLKSLGLSLVPDLARQIGGRLELGPGPGASFAVTFTPAAS